MQQHWNIAISTGKDFSNLKNKSQTGRLGSWKSVKWFKSLSNYSVRVGNVLQRQHSSTDTTTEQ